MQAVKLATLMKVPQVITTEGEPSTSWGENLTFDQQVFTTAEKLYEPLRMAADLGIPILLEPHGLLTDSPVGMKAILDALGNADNLGINFDTGNSWLGGSDPVE